MLHLLSGDGKLAIHPIAALVENMLRHQKLSGENSAIL
jgi:hypothetical protein